MDWRKRFRYIIWPRITKPFRFIGDFLGRTITIYRATLLLTLIAITIWYITRVDISELWPNIIPELLSIAITVFIIDTLYRKRSDDELKKVLIKQLGSKNNAVASEALKELDARGWLNDGTLNGAFLISANLDGNSISGADMIGVNLSFASLIDTSWFETDLEGAFLDHANLQDATLSMHAVGPHFAEANLKDASLSNANLRNSKIRPEQLCKVKSLWRATMPDGSLYDGRYNLQYDIDLFRKSGGNTNNPSELAFFYNVNEANYLDGQEWAKKHPHLFS